MNARRWSTTTVQQRCMPREVNHGMVSRKTHDEVPYAADVRSGCAASPQSGTNQSV